jgi:phosphatidate cytidylyltransferase
MFENKTMLTLLSLMGLLSLATTIIYIKYPTQELKDRVNSWWYILAFFSFGIMLNTSLAMFFFAFLSFLALKEYFTLIPSRRTDRRVMFYAYLMFGENHLENIKSSHW